MLRINLLPPYVFDKQKKVKVWVAWIVGVLICIGAFAFANKVATDLQTTADSEKETALRLQKDKEGWDSKKKQQEDKIAETQKKQTFIADAQSWNDSWWQLYNAMRDVTSPKVILRKMYLANPTTVNVVGWAPTEKEAADWWINFRNKYTGKDSPFSNVTFDLPKLVYPPNADNPGGAASAPGVSAPGGPRGLGSAGGFGAGAPAGFGGGASSGSTTDEEPGPGFLEDRLGINFRVHVTLRTPFDNGKPLPTWGAPETPAAGGAGAFGGGAPGGPGGRGRGAPPGSPSGPPPGAPSGGGASEDDSGGTGKRGRRGGGGEN